MEYNLIMDNDSGYVSHNQESNFDSSSENIYQTKSATPELFLNEDALLERPLISNVHNMNTFCKHSESFDSVLNESQQSVKTEFSGFDESCSDGSFVIPEVQQIVCDSKVWDEEKINSLPVEEVKPVHKVLANVTNTYDQNLSHTVKNSSADKENINPAETPKKRYENFQSAEISPDIFGEEETFIKHKSPMKKDTPKENYCTKDTKLLKNVQSSLSGVHPPPSVTIIQMSVTEMLNRVKENQNLFWNASSTVTHETGKSLLINDRSECVHLKWPEVSKCRYHGLHYNRNKISEEFEHLCLRYAERYVGVETQSSCTVFDSNPPSSQKRKTSKPRWNVKSPGRRLSHLARRRITFSSANLQANSSSAILGSRARQILVDARKLSLLKKSPSRKSPRKTPSKSPFKVRKNTPSSSAKKKLAMRFREMSGEFENMVASTSSQSQSGLTFKRALFSNEKETGSFVASMEKKSTKRALFVSPLKHSPSKKSPLKLGGLDKKRKRTDMDGNTAKFARSMSFDTQSTKSDSSLFLNRTLSESFNTTRTEEMSDQHIKKLQWAVYESLRLQNITPTHPQYKVFASVLARVTRKFLPTLRFEGRTTEKMFRIARYHSHAVVKGKTVDEIVNEYMKNRMKSQKPHGYVGIEEFNKTMNDSATDKENVLQDKANIMESIEKRRELAGSKSRLFSQNKIDRIRKVISFEETET